MGSSAAGGRTPLNSTSVRLLCVGLLLLAVLFLLALPASGTPPSSGDWDIVTLESYENQTLVIEGNIFIHPGGTLNLTNVTLEINSTNATRRGIVVESGGALNTRDLDLLAATSLDRTVIRPVGASDRFTFAAAPGSTISLRQTAIWGVGYTQSPINASAVYLNTSSVALDNLTVFSSFFGIYFAGVTGTFYNLAVHNNSYDGLEVDSTSSVTVRGLLAANNGGAGVYVSGGQFNLTNATLLQNDQGFAVKFGGQAAVSQFDASGNSIGFVVLNTATLLLSSGRVTNSTTSGLDARLASVVLVDSVSFSENPIGVFASASTVTQQFGSFAGGIRAVVLRSGASGTWSNLSFTRHNGDTIDVLVSSADFYRCVFDGNAFGGSVTGGSAFGFLDSTLSNSTAGGFFFTNTTGIYFHNPMILKNKGTAISLAGASSALLDANTLAEVNSSTLNLHQVFVTGTLRLYNATVVAYGTPVWNVTGRFEAFESAVSGSGGASGIVISGSGAAVLRNLTLSSFSLRLNGPAVTSSVDGLFPVGSSVMSAENGTHAWQRVIAGVGSGALRAANGRLTVTSGYGDLFRAEDNGHIHLIDFAANFAGAVVNGSGSVSQSWSLTLLLEWQAGVAAGGQNFTLKNASGLTAAAGVTDFAGRADLGPVFARIRTALVETPSSPFVLTGGSGGWASTFSFNLTAPTTVTLRLNDTLPPALAISSPANGSATSTSPVVISGTAADAESGILDLAWSYDNSTFNPDTSAVSFSVSIPAPFETTYQVTLRVHDKAGNAAFATVTFRVDRTPPAINLVQPANNSLQRGPTVRIIGATESGATLTINGAAVSVDANGDFDVNLTLADGSQSLAFAAVDRAGNTGSLSLVVRVDATPPAIIVEDPTNGSTVSSLTVNVHGRVEPGATLTVDGFLASVLSNGSFDASVDLMAEGPNTLVLRAVDGAGNVNQTVWALVRDTRAPQISVAGLNGPGPFGVNSSRPTFNITSDEFALIDAIVAPGGSADVASGFSLLFQPVLLEGNATLTVVATDEGGNRRTATYRLVVDFAAPNITLDPQTAGGAVNGNPWPVVVTSEAGATVTVNGVPAMAAPGSSTTYTAAITLTSGMNTLTVVVTDAAGNRAVRTLTLTLDQTPPSLGVSTPIEGARTEEKIVVVHGQTEAGANVTVDGTPVSVAPDGSFAATVPLVPGSNQITIRATDAAGNTATVKRTVVRTGAGFSLTGIPALDQNLGAILLLLLAIVVWAAIAGSRRARRRQLADKSGSLDQDLSAATAMRNDLRALEEFSPTSVHNPDFISMADFRRDTQEGREPTGRLEPTESRRKPR